MENKKKIWHYKYMHEVNETNDIKFRGIFSYRHLRIMAWLFLALAQIGTMLVLGGNAAANPDAQSVGDVLKFFSTLMAPLFLVAAFSQVIVAKDGYRRLFLVYGGAALGIFVGFIFAYEHYFVGLVSALQPEQGRQQAEAIFAIIQDNFAFSFNIFIDLLLCTLLTFFINYRPKKIFKGKKIYIFRALAALPIIYEATSILLKVLATNNVIGLHPYVCPLLTTKPIVAFFVFVAMAFFMKARERFFIKQGMTHQDYVKFQETNVNRFQFAKFLSVSLIIAAVVDAALFISIWVVLVRHNTIGVSNPEEFYAIALGLTKDITSWGIGGTFPMIFVVPIVFFFDYKKTYKDKLPDIIIPALGIILVAFIYLEGLYQAAVIFLSRPSSTPGGDEGGGEATRILFNAAQYLRIH